MAAREEAAKYIDSSKFTEKDIIDRVDAFAMRMQRGYFKKKQLKIPEPEFLEVKTPIGSRYKTKRPPPKPNEITAICHEAIVQM